MIFMGDLSCDCNYYTVNCMVHFDLHAATHTLTSIMFDYTIIEVITQNSYQMNIQ